MGNKADKHKNAKKEQQSPDNKCNSNLPDNNNDKASELKQNVNNKYITNLTPVNIFDKEIKSENNNMYKSMILDNNKPNISETSITDELSLISELANEATNKINSNQLKFNYFDYQ